jgi:hypothetical protein
MVFLVQMPNGFMDDFSVVKGCNNGCNKIYDSGNTFIIFTLKIQLNIREGLGS